MNKRMLSYILVSLSILLSLLFFDKQLMDFSKKLDLTTLVGIAAIASGISGVMMSLSSKRVANFEAIREYFQQGDTPEMISSRNKIYASADNGTPLDYKAAAEVCSFFHFWGMMVQKGFLPLWIFKSASGPSVVRLFHLVLPYIEERRTANNRHYGEGFEYLVKKIKKEYKYTYVPVVQQDQEQSNTSA
ncbi:hypothetical protein QNH48_28360 [Neobacillus sp. YX16]|uniref:DUF4760 domain-containing protein n=1 Tax=Neobacillus sp. YX16 TaxID=3047874 RepID=UPI0024C290C0|nr:hypothetical protein [Neobacillus sp. YX16]WHZ02787.1 hypothetical protein QNH48_28360 [Neobacillus sp. YX16]